MDFLGSHCPECSPTSIHFVWAQIASCFLMYVHPLLRLPTTNYSPPGLLESSLLHMQCRNCHGPKGNFPCVFPKWPLSSSPFSVTVPLKSTSQFLNFGLCFPSPVRCCSLLGFNFLHWFKKCYQCESQERCGLNSYAFLLPRITAQSGCGGWMGGGNRKRVVKGYKLSVLR